MSASLLYRISSGLLVLFALGHTIGFRQVDPRWGADNVVGGMRNVTFPVQGFNRSYWDFFSGFGLFVSVFLVFAAILAWQLGSMSRERLSEMPGVRWSFALCLVFIAVLSWRYFFVTPGVFSTLLALGLVGAAWLGG
ncbi:MAG TPA: hypothetical protein VGQ98_00760 [Gemmatimonadaceae bacterium]|nr:hypothetical protein [Gemmatimonadaceae bacterium]